MYDTFKPWHDIVIDVSQKAFILHSFKLNFHAVIKTIGVQEDGRLRVFTMPTQGKHLGRFVERADSAWERDDKIRPFKKQFFAFAEISGEYHLIDIWTRFVPKKLNVNTDDLSPRGLRSIGDHFHRANVGATPHERVPVLSYQSRKLARGILILCWNILRRTKNTNVHPAILHYSFVKISGPFLVTMMVFSTWALREPSFVRKEWPSLSTKSCPEPSVIIGSIAMTRPSTIFSPLPGSPKLGTRGSSCSLRPTPWPQRFFG